MGPAWARGGNGVLKVDGQEVASKKISGSIPAILTIDETLDIGSDTRTPVDDADYQVPFPFTGTIHTVGFKLGPSELMPEDHKAAQDMKDNANK
jgi:arylsulfatase